MLDTVWRLLNIVSSIPEWGVFVTSIRNLLIVSLQCFCYTLRETGWGKCIADAVVRESCRFHLLRKEER